MEKKILIACAMQQDEIEKYRKQLNITYPVVYLQRGLHRNPSVLRNLLQQEIDRHQDVDIILLTYGLCGRGTEGIVSWNTELVMPRFHDCIHQLLENHVIRILFMQQERGQLTRSPLEASAAPFLLLMAENGGWKS